MCPEYGIYHTRFPQDRRGFISNEQTEFVSLLDLEVRR